MDFVKRAALCAASLAIMFSISGCSGGSVKNGSNEIPMPTTAKQETGNIIEIPFPYIKIFSNGVDERWMIQRVNSPDNLIFTIMYNHGKEGKNYQLKPPYKGSQNLNGNIKLSGKSYKMISITLNKDLESGSVKLKP